MKMWEMEKQRDAYGEALVELGRERDDIVVLGADLAGSCRLKKFGEEFPERMFNMGIAEQNMTGVAAGLALSGKTVFSSTFAVFATGRAYDQVRQSIAYPKLDVKIVSTHAGITVGGDGASHQMLEDIALMRVIPNVKVVAPADYHESRKATFAIAEEEGPFYMRMGRSSVPVITEKDDPFEVGKATMLREGGDVTLIGTGIMVSECLKAAEILNKQHEIDAKVLNMSTIKPLDDESIVESARDTGGIVTAEEHVVSQGMGSGISQVLAESNYHVPLKRVGIPNVFGESGESDELMEKYGLTAEHIVESAHDVLERR
ncbi:MAG: transketolase family protein [Candidatus Thermoplasmatota archaeon]